MSIDLTPQADRGRLSHKWGRLWLAMKAARELGPQQVWLYARYWLGQHSGIYRRMRPPPGASPLNSLRLFSLYWSGAPARERLLTLLGEQDVEQALAEADQIVAGKVRLFGGPPVELQLRPAPPLKHWVDAEIETAGMDIKYTWEPARFGWVAQLARAYRLQADESYAESFWQYFEAFVEANPAYLGPNWASAQEVALRMLALVFAGGVFAASRHSTPDRVDLLEKVMAEHAARIPPTLVYARAQNNNHLLSEAAALFTAGLLLEGHPQAQNWLDLGRKWFNAGLQAQIDPDGVYIQHSANYQRLALQLALWVAGLKSGSQGDAGRESTLSAQTLQVLAASTRWLLALVDSHNGQAPNLGPNDGAYFLPLSGCAFDDYRPVLQAAARRFLGAPAFPPGPWDEMGLWLVGDLVSTPAGPAATRPHPDEQAVQRARPAAGGEADHPGGPTVLRCPASDSWAYLRAAQFHSRPGHADQLHLDLWWRGINLARDAGTYLYNAAPPWDNALSCTAVHNTLLLNGLDQMQRAGRFLYLGWAQARLVDAKALEHGAYASVVAEHDGYRRLGVIQRRSVFACQGGGWLVEDRLLAAGKPSDNLAVRLHWLLPDWPWEIRGHAIQLESPHGAVRLDIGTAGEKAPIQVDLVRAGELLSGPGPAVTTAGWYSPTYGTRLPALSFSVRTVGGPGLCISSRWTLGVNEAN